MTTDKMTTILRRRLEEKTTSPTTFTDAVLLDLLNNANTKLAQLLDDGYLTELEVIDTSLTATNGTLDFSSLTYEVLRGREGIHEVKITNGLYCNEVEKKDLKGTENSYRAGSATNPLYNLYAQQINVIAGVTSPVIDVSYLKTVSDLIYELTANQADSGASATKFDGADSEGLSAVDDYYNGAVIYSDEHSSYHVITDYVGADLEFTVSPAAAAGNFTEGNTFHFVTSDFDQTNLSGTRSELNESLHTLIIDLAEFEGWGIEEKSGRQQVVKEALMQEIATLNAKYNEVDGVGDKERNKRF